VDAHVFTEQAENFQKARKLMATVFWDKTGLLMVEFMQQGTTIRSALYCETLKNCVVQFRKMYGMLTSGVVLLHDDARPHTAARTGALLRHFNWELFDHTPYSPDVTQSDRHLFTYLKN
jgi:hypothetical protein